MNFDYVDFKQQSLSKHSQKQNRENLQLGSAREQLQLNRNFIKSTTSEALLKRKQLATCTERKKPKIEEL